MDFDERLIGQQHVRSAVERYCRERPGHPPAKSAFLFWDGEKLPAKYILRLAFQDATGCWPKAETLTGGRASVRVLQSLGFDAIYEKPERRSSNRNPVKSERRAAFQRILEARYGRVVTEWKVPSIIVPDLEDRTGMDLDLARILDAVEKHRSIRVRGRKGHKLAFDLFLAEHNLPIEFDERQHFTPLRAVSLRNYPSNTILGFDHARWIRLSDEIRAGDNSPAYRDEQRAFYDAIRDLLAPRIGLLPVVRVFEEDVRWESDGASSESARRVLNDLDSLIRQKSGGK